MYRKLSTILLTGAWALLLTLHTADTQTPTPTVLIYTNSSYWMLLEDAERTAETTKRLLQSNGIQVEITKDDAYLRQWMLQTTGDGKVNVVVFYGVLPDSIYPTGNTQPDGSIAENWIETTDGDTILNHADYLAFNTDYDVDKADHAAERVIDGTTAVGSNGGSGLRNLMDNPDISLFNNDVPMIPTTDGLALAPSLVNFGTYRPMPLNQLQGEWVPEKVFASDTGNAEANYADPVILRDGNRGRLAIVHATFKHNGIPNAEVAAEIINNYLLNPTDHLTNNATDHATTFLTTNLNQDSTTWNLPEGARARLGKGSINELAYSPDGTLLAIASTIGVWLYDTNTYQEINLLTEHTGRVESVAFSPDGTTLASGSSWGSIQLWDVATGTVKQTLTGHTVWSVAFSPDGTTLASGSADDTIRLWDVDTGTVKQTLTGHTGWVWSVAFSPDGTTLASGSRDNTIRLWDVATGTGKQTLTGHTREVRSVAFSPDGTTLASGSTDNSIRFWDVATGTLKNALTGHGGSARSVAFSPDGTTLATGSWTGIRLWDVDTGTLKNALTGHTGEVRSVAFSPDGNALASGSWDDTIRLWDVATGTLKQTLTGHTGWVNSVAFSPDENTLASISWSTIGLWDVATGTLKNALTGHTGWAWSVAFSPDGNTLASGGGDGIRLWDVATGTLKNTLTGHTVLVYSVAFSPDGNTLATGSEDNTIRLWDVATGTLKNTLTGHTSRVESVAFSPDGNTLASGSWDNTIRLWDVATGTVKQTLTGYTGWVSSVAFSPDGNTLASGGGDDTIRLWDVDIGTLRNTLTGHTSRVESVAFSPDGNTLATGSADGTVLLWDIETSEPERLAQLKDPNSKGGDRWVDLETHDPSLLPSLTSDDSQTETEIIFVNLTEAEIAYYWVDGTGEEIHYKNVASGDVAYQPTYVGHVWLVKEADGDDLAIFRAVEKTGRALLGENTDTSLILYLSFDELNGNQVIDHSQYQNHGTLIGNPQVVDGKFGKALKLNGESDWVEVPHHDSLTVDQDVTVMAWIHTSRYHGPGGALWQGILGKSNNLRSYSFYTTAGGQLHLSVSAHIGSNSDEKIALNEWQHVVAQVDSGWHRYWINGKNVGNFPRINAALPGKADTASVRIGNTHDNTALNRHFLGLIDEVRIWNRALSEAQILQQMGQGLQPRITDTNTDGEETLAGTSEAEELKSDVNGDGAVNIQDLVQVAANFGATGENAADVNGDGQVNIQDLVAVAAAFGEAAAAPAAHATIIEHLTATEVKHWLYAAQHANLTDPAFQRGVEVLKHLLALLTPKETALLPNYPNPFNPETWIPYQLATPADVALRIYAVDGSLVRVLSLGHKTTGIYESRTRAAYWDGRNNLGEPVASGLYFYTLTAGDFTATRKMLIRK